MEKQPLTPRTPLLHNLNETKREPREWDAQAYDEGNRIQTEAFLNFLKKNNIDTNNKTILDVGCGTGKIAAKLAQKVRLIHGFDASENMIKQAQTNFGHIENLSFQHSFAEDFTSPKLYQLAIASFCIHWFENQKQAFQRIGDSLEHNGYFFATVQTSDNPTPLELVAAQETIEAMPINKAYKWCTEKNLIDLTECTLPSTQQLKDMLNNVGFEILICEQQDFYMSMTKDEIIKTARPIVFSRPLMKFIPNLFIEPLFNDYIDCYLSKLNKIDDKYVEQIITTIIHVRKK
jgi:trans-aconitate methyltransferase